MPVQDWTNDPITTAATSTLTVETLRAAMKKIEDEPLRPAVYYFHSIEARDRFLALLHHD